MAVVLLLAFYAIAAWVIFWVVPRSLRRSRPEIPSTVPQEWVDEFQADE